MIGLAFSPEQFKVLLRMIYIANTVANGHRDANYLKEYDELEQYIFSRAKDAGFPAATWRHKIAEEEHHHPSRIFEDDVEIANILDEYDAHIAFAFFAERLAERDVERKYGANAKEGMPAQDHEELVEEVAAAYRKEFEDHGFANITVGDMGAS